MKNLFKIFIIFLTIVLGHFSLAIAHESEQHGHKKLVPIPPYSQAYGEAGAQSALKAANAFIDSFNDKMKARLIFEVNAEERSEWSNLPAGIVERVGLSVGDMSEVQRKLLFDFLASSLSKEGYENVMNIMAAEAFLSQDKRAKRLKWAPENYFISIYGQPSATSSWGWQFGGHHLGLNLSIENNRIISLSPSFIGTEPAIFTLDNTEYESVIPMHLSGYKVYESLSEEQRLAADAEEVPEDVLAGPGEDGFIPPKIGLSASKMNAEQQKLLLAAIYKWVGLQPSENADKRMAEIKKELDDVTFAWIGDNQVNTPTYMRIQGPSLLIELQSSGENIGDSASGMGHYHTIYRHFGKDYGGTKIKSSWW